MDGLNFVKEILIQPFYTEEGEGRRIKYVIDLKDSMLQNSTIIQKMEEIDMIKEWMGKSFVVTELLFRATKDGFTAQSFHTKCNDKGATITLVKAKNGGVFGAYATVAWTSSGNYAVDANAFLFHVTKKAKLE